jgi:hypothetical protein
MLNHEEVSDETQALFEERVNTQNLENLRFKVISNDKLKKSKDNMCGKVVVENPVARDVHNNDVIFIINESIFDQLLEEHQIIVIDKMLAQVEYDMEKEKVSKNTPDIQEFSGILEKYPFTMLQALSLSIAQLYEKKGEDETKNDGTSIEDDF